MRRLGYNRHRSFPSSVPATRNIRAPRPCSPGPFFIFPTASTWRKRAGTRRNPPFSRWTRGGLGVHPVHLKC